MVKKQKSNHKDSANDFKRGHKESDKPSNRRKRGDKH